MGDVAGNREKELAMDITKSDDGKCGERRIGMGNEEWGMGNGKGEWRLDNEDWIPVEIRSKERQVPEN